MEMKNEKVKLFDVNIVLFEKNKHMKLTMQAIKATQRKDQEKKRRESTKSNEKRSRKESKERDCKAKIT